jgi:hypothetical protein
MRPCSGLFQRKKYPSGTIGFWVAGGMKGTRREEPEGEFKGFSINLFVPQKKTKRNESISGGYRTAVRISDCEITSISKQYELIGG